MIDPDIEIVDLDPEGFALLCELSAPRAYASGAELHVLHDSGTVIDVVDTRTGHVDAHRAAFADPQVRADELLAATDLDRVVLVDVARRGELAGALVAAAQASPTQPELLWASGEAFWSSPAVATAPEPPRHDWRELAQRLAAIGDGWWGVLGAWHAESLVLDVAFRVRGGLVVSATSVGERTDTPDELLAGADRLGDVRVALLCELGDLRRLFEAPDPLAAVRELSGSGRLLAERGIDLLSG